MTDTPLAARRRALITGASGGLGAALARNAPPTFDLLLTGRDAGALTVLKVAAEAQGRQVEIVAADLDAPEGRRALIAAAEGRIDVLVNNAGLGAYGSFLSRDPTEHRAAVVVNALAPVELSRALLPGMIERARALGGRAGLMNVASSAAFAPAPSMAVYAATKAFLLSFTEALAAELSGDPVDVLALCPGATESNFGLRSGFGRSFPGAMSPDYVAKQAWSALGKRRTLVLGALDAPALAPVALARSAAAQAIWRGSRLAGALFRR